ncbi:MAG: hypothetical protein ACD_4C00137G0004 [uncultured bacterium (gcode 4)]|uniref:Uncharacterized protein n=1 Tax=uncultured bacterium (gcode 4) TaxID=1234023 RepID=K2FV54_9BACT|nr:MAG: hypothetical protein ACD_4C00137G0004 [uncultured bacterium (gcode 4)]
MEKNEKSREDDRKELSENEKRKLLKDKISEKIKKLKELIKSLWLNNLWDLMKFLDNVELSIDSLNFGEFENAIKKIQDEIIILIEKDNKLKADAKLKFAMLFNGDDNTWSDNSWDDNQFAYL